MEVPLTYVPTPHHSLFSSHYISLPHASSHKSHSPSSTHQLHHYTQQLIIITSSGTSSRTQQAVPTLFTLNFNLPADKITRNQQLIIYFFLFISFQEHPKVSELRQLMNKNTKVYIQDGRLFCGRLACFDKQKNVLLNECEETRPASGMSPPSSSSSSFPLPPHL